VRSALYCLLLGVYLGKQSINHRDIEFWDRSWNKSEHLTCSWMGWRNVVH